MQAHSKYPYSILDTFIVRKETKENIMNKMQNPCLYLCTLINQNQLDNLGDSHYYYWANVSVQFSRSVVSDSLWPHESQHARPPCPSPTPVVHPNSCPLSQWCHPTISSSVVPFSSPLQSFPASGSFPESALHIRCPTYWSFSFSIIPSSEHSGLISFRMDWLDFLAV